MKKWLLFSVLAVLLAMGGIAFYIFSQPPKNPLSKEFEQEAATKILGRKAVLDPVAEKTGNTSYAGKYVTFDYPAKAVIYKYKDPYGYSGSKDQSVETFSFDMQSPKVVFNMSVVSDQSQARTASDLSGVHFREANIGTYQGGDVVVDGQKGRVYEKKDPAESEKTVFFLINGSVYTFSLTGDLNEIRRVYQVIVSNLKFTNLN